ncbi:MAG: hypothetical protein LBM62_01460 [Mediterranea sp.]|jgi:hypothetical protein|nr:hypothetical protein [Mediterranea sp.]
MKLKQHLPLLVLGIAFSIASCTTSSSEEGAYALSFIPRSVNYIGIQPIQRIAQSVNGIDGYIDWDVSADGVPADDLVLSLWTSNTKEGVTANLDHAEQGIPSLEHQIERSYKRAARAKLPLDVMEYRLTGVSALTITANRSLFGEPVGTSLNNKIKIDDYRPPYIADYRSMGLLYGFDDLPDLPVTIDQWLALYPLAQPVMRLMFAEMPTQLPAVVRFTVTMVTSEGRGMGYTTPGIQIIPS